MNRRVIELVDHRTAALDLPRAAAAAAPAPGHSGGSGTRLRDALGRPLRDLRISVTDRCNFRCSYCMPKDVFGNTRQYLPHSALLTFEEITRLARLFVAQGVTKLRITGGEPLLRRGIEILIAQLAALRGLAGQPLDISLTTNAALLARKAQTLKNAGLSRVTVSLDGLDDAVFRRMNGVDFPVAQVLAGIEAARAAGLDPVKVNMVVQRGVNEDQILPMARHFRGTGVTVRFVEFMDVGNTNGWRMRQVVPSARVLRLLQTDAPLTPLQASAPGETARRWGWCGAGGQHDAALGEIGLISSVTQAFCADCTRARLSTDGKLFLCLFASQGYDLRERQHAGASDAELLAALAAVWQSRADRYSQLRASLPGAARQKRPHVEMSYIGG
ncbi:MAG: GTP 3',8-cyclase MoaA [Burkholderiaceae bacterium]|jgi:cyclic pyranopterin phosphate synthase|nr:GTP 3',8-cyclase MoaA [Burkholderiaceae bacterium]